VEIEIGKIEGIFKTLKELGTLYSDIMIVHGDCHGADKIAEEMAIKLGYSVKAFPADWGKHGKAAGPIRNSQMLKEKLEFVIAFHDDIDDSRGTKDMIKQSLKMRIPVMLVNSKGDSKEINCQL
jgi:hypothetical protein